MKTRALEPEQAFSGPHVAVGRKGHASKHGSGVPPAIVPQLGDSVQLLLVAALEAAVERLARAEGAEAATPARIARTDKMRLRRTRVVEVIIWPRQQLECRDELVCSSRRRRRDGELFRRIRHAIDDLAPNDAMIRVSAVWRADLGISDPWLTTIEK